MFAIRSPFGFLHIIIIIRPNHVHTHTHLVIVKSLFFRTEQKQRTPYAHIYIVHRVVVVVPRGVGDGARREYKCEVTVIFLFRCLYVYIVLLFTFRDG